MSVAFFLKAAVLAHAFLSLQMCKANSDCASSNLLHGNFVVCTHQSCCSAGKYAFQELSSQHALQQSAAA